MKKLTLTGAVASAVLLASMLAAAADAQTATGITPTLYNQSGTIVNQGGVSEPAGWYYNSSGQQIYYYGNGTYYDPSTGTYGGQAFVTSVAVNTGTTPILYNQSGAIVNPGGTSESAGWYYDASGDQIYYYGNGTYYDPSTGTYGGQAFGTTAATPGVPNTGVAGDQVTYAWLAIVLSALVAIGGVTYLSRGSSTSKMA